MDPDPAPAPDPDPTPDPIPFFNDFKDVSMISVRSQHIYGEKGRIRSQIRTSVFWIRIAQKHADPADPDPQHWLSVKTHNRVQRKK